MLFIPRKGNKFFVQCSYIQCKFRAGGNHFLRVFCIYIRVFCIYISSFSENYFPSNANNGFHWQKNSSDQKALFPLDRKSVSTSRMMGLLKNAFPIYRKVASTLKNLKIVENIEKNWCSLTLIYFAFKNGLNNSFHQQKKLGIEQYCFQQTKNSFPPAEMKDWPKKMFQLKNELFPQVAVDCCLGKSKKIGSTGQTISRIS